MLTSFALLPVFAAAAFAQAGTAIPQSTSTPNTPQTNCNACFIVADVAQVIFADYTTTQTASAVASVGNGRNGTVVTTTFVQPLGPFSFDSSGILGGQTVTGSYVQLSGSTFMLNGATLTSPTAYNVFTAYTSFTKTANAAGSCVTSQITVVPLARASSYSIQPNAPSSEVFDAEMSFFSQIGKATCSPGGVVVTTQIPVSVTTTTTTSSTTSFSRPTMLPQSTAAASTMGGSSSAAVAAATSTSTSTSTSASGSSVVLLTPTPVVTGAASTFQPYIFSSNILAALFALPGIAAWML